MPLYPELQPFHQFRLAVDEVHSLYVEQCGNPRGQPVVVLHGGPGGGCSPALRRFFNPDHWHIILFDQRGAGRSTPRGCLVNNTTADLRDDLEVLRQTLNIDRWYLFGGSWGATLALYYAQCFPARVAGLVLRGVFLGRQQDLDWLYRGGAARLQPQAWEAFLSPLDDSEHADPLQAYYRRLHGASGTDAEQLAGAWAQWEAVCSTLTPSPLVERGFAANSLPLARIETHYFVEHCFLQAHPLLDNMNRISDVPGIVVHGRYDLVCPVEQSHQLCQRWPAAELRVIPAAGHSVREPGIEQALLEAVADMARTGGTDP